MNFFRFLTILISLGCLFCSSSLKNNFTANPDEFTKQDDLGFFFYSSNEKIDDDKLNVIKEYSDGFLKQILGITCFKKISMIVNSCDSNFVIDFDQDSVCISQFERCIGSGSPRVVLIVNFIFEERLFGSKLARLDYVLLDNVMHKILKVGSAYYSSSNSVSYRGPNGAYMAGLSNSYGSLENTWTSQVFSETPYDCQESYVRTGSYRKAIPSKNAK